MLTLIIAITDFLNQHKGKKIALVDGFRISFIIKEAKGTEVDKA